MMPLVDCISDADGCILSYHVSRGHPVQKVKYSKLLCANKPSCNPHGECSWPWPTCTAALVLAGPGSVRAWCRSGWPWLQKPAAASRSPPRHLDQRRQPCRTARCRHRRVAVHHHCTGRVPVCGMGRVCRTATELDPKLWLGTAGCWENLALSPRYHKGCLPGSSSAPMAEI